MASLSVVVILGGKKPLVVLLTSSCADAAGEVVPIPKFCAMLAIVSAKKNKMVNALFMCSFLVRPARAGLVFNCHRI